EELDILVKKWKLNEFHLMGSSWGTTLALEYYLRRKGHGVHSLIFQSPLFVTRDWQKDADRLIEGLPSRTRKIIHACHEIGATDSKVYQNAMMEFYLKHVLRDKKKLMALFTGSSGFNKDLYEYMWGPSEFKSTGTLKNYNRLQDLKRIRVPTLFICGQYDEATPLTVRKYHRLVSGSEFQVLKKCSHAIGSENPKLLQKTVADFLKNI